MITDKQTALKTVGWDTVEEEIARSTAHKTGRRIRWADYFGRSLNKEIASLVEYGFNKQEIFKRLSDVLAQKGVDDKDVYRKLHIGVCARVGEAESREKQQRHIRHKTGIICPHCAGKGRL